MVRGCRCAMSWCDLDLTLDIIMIRTLSLNILSVLYLRNCLYFFTLSLFLYLMVLKLETISTGCGIWASSAIFHVIILEVQEMEQNLPRTCSVRFDDPNKLYMFTLTIVPDEGYWQGGKFKFHVSVPEDYNIAVSLLVLLLLARRLCNCHAFDVCLFAKYLVRDKAISVKFFYPEDCMIKSYVHFSKNTFCCHILVALVPS